MTMIMDRLAHGSSGNHRRPARRAFWIVAGAAIDNLVTALLDWQERARQRRQLDFVHAEVSHLLSFSPPPHGTVGRLDPNRWEPSVRAAPPARDIAHRDVIVLTAAATSAAHLIGLRIGSDIC